MIVYMIVVVCANSYRMGGQRVKSGEGFFSYNCSYKEITPNADLN